MDKPRSAFLYLVMGGHRDPPLQGVMTWVVVRIY